MIIRLRSYGAPAVARCGHRWLACMCVSALAWLATSCSLLRNETEQTKSLVQSLAGGKGAKDPAQQMTELQAMVMREADQYAALVAQGADDFQTKLGTTEARITALRWKLEQATSAYITATGENPALNAVDMVVLATVSRLVVEDFWMGDKFGAAAQPLLEIQRRLETNAWVVAEQAMTPEQRDQLRELIQQWRAENPHVRNVAAARFSDLVKLLEKRARSQPGQLPTSLLSLAGVNPLAGLDPAVQAVEQTRQLAARAMYYAERAPRLLSWQVELLTYQLAEQPESQQVLADVGRVSKATQSFAQTAEGLPGLIKEEREAAINQLLAGVAQERSNILATLEAQEAQLKELLPQVRETLKTGGDMGDSLKGAIQSLDAFVHYVSPPETNAVPQPPDTNSLPFNILDYGKTATEIAAMAKEINTLLTSLNQDAPVVAKLSQQTAADLKTVVDHAFRRGLILIAALGIVALLVVWLSRRLGVTRDYAQSPPKAGTD